MYLLALSEDFCMANIAVRFQHGLQSNVAQSASRKHDASDNPCTRLAEAGDIPPAACLMRLTLN